MTPSMFRAQRSPDRIANAFFRDRQGVVHEPSRRLLAVFAVGVCVAAPLGAWTLATGIQAKVMSHSWTRAAAEVVAVAGPRGRDPVFDLALRLRRDDGASIETRSIRPHPLRASWSEPKRIPAAGERLDVLVDPSDPRRMTTVASLGSPVVAILGGCGISAFAGFGLVGLVAGLRLRRGGTAPAR